MQIFGLELRFYLLSLDSLCESSAATVYGTFCNSNHTEKKEGVCQLDESLYQVLLRVKNKHTVTAERTSAHKTTHVEISGILSDTHKKKKTYQTADIPCIPPFLQ